MPVAIKTEKFIYSQKKRGPVRSQLGIDNKAIVVGYVGRLSMRKIFLCF